MECKCPLTLIKAISTDCLICTYCQKTYRLQEIICTGNMVQVVEKKKSMQINEGESLYKVTAKYWVAEVVVLDAQDVILFAGPSLSKFKGARFSKLVAWAKWKGEGDIKIELVKLKEGG